MTGDELLATLHRVADKIAAALEALDDWSPAGTRAGQYRSDLAADAVAVASLLDAGVGVLSEESGRHAPERPVTVVVDPLDGSTNAHRRVPWYATSLCAVDGDGPLAAVVVDLARGVRFEATRGGGARRDGRPIAPSGEKNLDASIIGLSGLPDRHLGWRQFRALGAAALDLCAVADGTLDGFVDCSVDAHGPWDYLGGLLVCREAGAVVEDAHGRELVVLDHSARRTPVAGATASLAAQLVAARSV
jgi:fructose-1,6-bisphosphatase/inositol monophosphatase family enzyme